MVFLAENRSLRMASCCSLLVVKGGKGFRLVVFFRTFSTMKASPVKFGQDGGGGCPHFGISNFFPSFSGQLGRKGGRGVFFEDVR